VQDYARFRAAAEHFAGPWQRWPVGARNRRLTARVAEPDAVDRHVYIQWLAEEQLERAASRGRTGEGLYLDLPLGVHESGYDTWRHREEFALGASGGAPPDMFFTKGQDWGFPPLHPRGIREGRHGYFIAAVRNLLRHAGALRIDHVMGLHRLFWVPRGMDAREGMYVRYPAEELYAILTLEAHRAGALVVGEDLGTVPRYVRRAMERHGVLRSYVLELETLDPERPLPEPPELSLATLGTHDMPPFAAFIEGLDVDDRVDQGLLNADQTNTERAARERQRRALAAALRERRLLRGPSPGAAAGPLTDAGHRYLATSPARMAVVNLEDLWGETEPQNRPGTGAEQPNWRRKASRSLEQLRDDPEVVDRLREVDRARRGGTAKAARSERPPPRTSPTRKGRQ
jgi:4-alpha-glucanotransferase